MRRTTGVPRVIRMRQRRAIIVGAGIGGLTAAIALRRMGIEAHVFEREPEFREAGAGISLWPNAVNPLRRLGVADAIKAAGEQAIEGSLRSWTGEPLGPAVAEHFERTFGAPLIVVHRASLQAALRAALPADAVALGHEAVAVEQDGFGAAVRFSDGSFERGDLVIGADGIRSRVRAAVVGDGEPRYSGYTAWRGIVSMDTSLANQVLLGESWGPASLFGVARLGGSQAYWWASVRAVRKGGGTADEEKEALLRRFAGWHPTVSALIEATVPEAIIRTPLYDRKPSARWTEGRVVLLGDAAHPMLPNLGQGACQAIEDAVALGDALQADANPPAALARYGAVRAKRANAIVRRSRQMARIAHLANPLAVLARNALLRASTPSDTLRRLEPLLAG
jgi:2-polyprenyl-6-methoxyphenol hydroxylase-like FAD-dependent oxidoreductase